MKYTVYKITNKINGKIYIGKHQTLDSNDGYMGSGKLLRRAQKKHGIENFEKEILHVFDNEDEMNLKEAELVSDEFCSRDDTYNICPGGQGGWGYVNVSGKNRNEWHENNPGHMKTMSNLGNAKKRFLIETDPEWKIKYKEKMKIGALKRIKNGSSTPFKGKKHTEETKNKMRKSKNVGSSNSQFGTMWITNGVENKKIKKVDIIPEGWYKGRKMINLKES